MNKLILLITLLITAPYLANADLCDDFNGKVQSLNMGRDRGGAGMPGGAHSATVAFTFDYRKCLPANFVTDFQVLYASTYYKGGAFSGAKGPDYNLSNSGFANLNEINIAYNFKETGLANTELKIGRQILDLNFVTAYNIRQKDQSFEAIVFHSGDIPYFDVTLGHLEKFSSWTSKDDLTTGSSANRFIDIEKTESFPYKTKGFQFVEMNYKEDGNTSFAVYDYYGHDLYNTLGVKGSYKWMLSADKYLDLKLHYLNQQDVGRYTQVMGTGIDANALQLGAMLNYKGFKIEPGIFLAGGNKSANTLHTPFQPALIIEEPMIETALGFEGGSTSYYLESSYKKNAHKYYFLYLHTKAGNDKLAEVISKEVNVIYKYDWGKAKGWYGAIKFSYLALDYKTGADAWSTDYRMFFGYKW